MPYLIWEIVSGACYCLRPVVFAMKYFRIKGTC